MPLTADEYDAVTARVGHAVWQIQVLEETLCCHLVLVHRVSITTARSEILSMFVKASKQTLGQLFSAIRDTPNAPQNLLPRLECFVEERNWLIHRTRHEHQSDLHSDSMRSALVARITAVADEALSLLKDFQRATEQHLIARGMNAAEMDARAAEIYREWTAGV